MISLRKMMGFLRDERGAITVDWVVLTAALIMLGIATAFVVTANLPGLAEAVSDTLVSMDVGT